MVKNLPAIQETRVQSLGLEDSLEEEMATHSSILAWKNSTDRGAWSAIVHGAAKSDTNEWLSLHFNNKMNNNSFLLHPKLCLQDSIWQQCTEAELSSTGKKAPKIWQAGNTTYTWQDVCDISGLGLDGPIKHISPVGETEIDEHFLQKW